MGARGSVVAKKKPRTTPSLKILTSASEAPSAASASSPNAVVLGPLSPEAHGRRRSKVLGSPGPLKPVSHVLNERVFVGCRRVGVRATAALTAPS